MKNDHTHFVAGQITIALSIVQTLAEDSETSPAVKQKLRNIDRALVRVLNQIANEIED